MLYKKFRTFAQIVGFVTIGLLAIFGLLSLFNGGNSVLAAVGLAPAAPQATVPQVMNYQGILKDTEGDPLDGTYTMTFRIYDSAVATTTAALWSEQHVGVTARSGHFNVLLGYNTPLPTDLFSALDRYVGVTVDPYDEMYPRQRFASVPYAFYAEEAYQADHAYALSAADDDPRDAVIVDNDGNVGIGTTSSAALEVNGQIIAKSGAPAETVTTHGYTFAAGGDQDGGMFSDADNTVKFATNGTTRMTISDGNVGIGTETPTQTLEVVGDRIHLRDLADTKGIALRTDGGAVDVDAQNADLWLNSTGNINMNPGDAFKLNAHKPIFFKKYPGLGDNVHINTGYSDSEWVCGIAGFDTGVGDIDENDAGDIMQVYLYSGLGSMWWLRADIRTHDDHENWDVVIMCVDIDMVDTYDY
jgi:hypothetical protein